MPERIYLSPPHLSGIERDFVEEAFDSNWVAPLGPQVDAFERELCEVVGGGHGAAVSSGTAALHLALRLVGVKPADEVVVSTFSFAASAFPVLYLGARPVFVDSEAVSWNMSPGLLEETLGRKARKGKLPAAVVVVHLYGQTADMAAIVEACRRWEVPVVEDAAEALGARYRGRAAGTLGDVGVLSFNGNKIITTGGGGMLVSEDEALVAEARKLASQAREPAPWYEHEVLGYNYRLSNVLAAIGRAQLRLLDDRVTARRRVFDAYRRELGHLRGIEFTPEAPWGTHTRWLTTLTVDADRAGFTAEDAWRALEADQVEARPVWKPLHLQPVFRGAEYVGDGFSEEVFRTGLCLPSGSTMTEEDVRRVASGVVRARDTAIRPAGSGKGGGS